MALGNCFGTSFITNSAKLFEFKSTAAVENSWILIMIQFFASFNSNGHDLLMISITSNEFSTDVNVRNGTKRQKIIRHDDPISLLDDKWWPVQFSVVDLFCESTQFSATFKVEKF